jgi:hypothetical protein
MWLTCFSEIGTALEAEQLHRLSLRSEKQERRFLLLQCHAPPQSLCSTLFAAVYKRTVEGGPEDFWGFGLLLLAFWCGKLLEGKRITEGKRIAEGKRMAKEGLIESLH